MQASCSFPRWLSLLPLCVLVYSIPGPDPGLAHAQPAVAPVCEEDPECNRLAEQGFQQVQAGQFDEAQRSYEKAYKRAHDPRLLYNLARALHKAGRSAEASVYYQRYLDAGTADGGERKQKAEQYLQQARSEAALTSTTSQPRSSTAVAREPGDPARATPVYKKWWLWTVVGVAAAGLAVGIGLGVAARRPDVSDAVEARPF